MRRCSLMIALTFLVSLVVASGAQAIVLSDAGTEAGVSLVPGARGNPLPTGVSAVSWGGSCEDPWLSSDLGGPLLPSDGLCYRGGAVMNGNETFALTWDPQRAYWSGTTGYVEQFLRDVADGSGTLTSPYALTQQYNDGGGRAKNASIYGGGCIDYGSVGGSACDFGNPSGAGHDYPANGCTPSGNSFTSLSVIATNTVCLTDGQLQGELATMISQTGIVGRTEPGYTPLVTVLLPPGVETCLDAAGNLCSANASLTPPPPTVSSSSTGGTITPGTYRVEVTYETASGESVPSAPQEVTTTSSTSTITISSPPPSGGVTGWYAYVTQAGETTYARQGGLTAIGSSQTLTAPPSGGAAPPATSAFCSYHSQLDVDGTEVPYLVQPWTAFSECDDPSAPPIQTNPTPQQLGVDVGLRLVSSISQSQIAAIVNPFLNGWVALNGSEIDDNDGCTPLPNSLDSVTVGSSSQNPYFLQREFNNAGVIEGDPNTYFGCAPNVILSPDFVVPSSVNPGDEVEFDGSPTASTLIVPNAGYQWSFGDGGTATGPSVEHSYVKGGNYTVTLTVTDRGGNVRTLSQTIQVLGSNGQPVSQPSTHGTKRLRIRLLLLPQGKREVLRKGLMARVSSNQRADGIAYVSISRSLAKRAHIKLGRGQSVVIGTGAVSGIKDGTVTLHLRLSKGVAAKLGRLSHVTLTVRLALVDAGGDRVAIDAAGRY